MADPVKQTLDIPQGVSFTIVDNSIILGNEADVVIRGDLGYKLKKVFSRSGSVQIIPPEGSEMDIEELEAEKGDVFINGHVRSNTVHAQRVFFDDGYLKAENVKGDKEVHLKGKKFQVFVVNAPNVTIEPDAQGMALVVECKHDIPRGQYMGGFRNVQEAKDVFSSFMKVFSPGEDSKKPMAETAKASADQATDDTKESVKKFFQKK
jgi:hypothetical protein